MCSLPWGALPLLTSPNWLHPLKRLGIPWNTAKGFPTLNAVQFSTCCGGGMALASSPKQGISFFPRVCCLYLVPEQKSLALLSILLIGS